MRCLAPPLHELTGDQYCRVRCLAPPLHELTGGQYCRVRCLAPPLHELTGGQYCRVRCLAPPLHELDEQEFILPKRDLQNDSKIEVTCTSISSSEIFIFRNLKKFSLAAIYLILVPICQRYFFSKVLISCFRKSEKLMSSISRVIMAPNDRVLGIIQFVSVISA